MAQTVSDYNINLFWKKVALTANDEKCWMWTGCERAIGYGSITANKKQYTTHRFSYLINKGEIPQGLCVLHTCDNRRCVNPKHLFLGTNADNSADMVRKNRQASGIKSGRFTKPEKTPRGENNGMAKLTERQVLEIRASGLSQRKLAKLYGICRNNVRFILKKKTWTHI